MLNNRLLSRTAHSSSRDGFTLVELLVVIGIIAILAGVALGPITNGIKQAKHNAAMQTCRQLGTMCFSYSTDNTANGNNYPQGADATVVAKLLLDGGYSTDPNIFVLSSQSGYTVATAAAGVWTVPNTAVSWCFTQGSATSGLSSSASDLTPFIFFNNGKGVSPLSPVKATGAADIPVTMLAAAPQGIDGIAVYYKGNNAVYLKADTTGKVAAFISKSDQDATSYPVAQ